MLFGLAALMLSACSAPQPASQRPKLKIDVSAYDPDGRPASGLPIEDEIVGLGDPAEASWSEPSGGSQDPGGDQDPAAQQSDPEQDPDPEAEARRQEAERRRRDAQLRNAFGQTILINSDGTVTKQFFLGYSAGAVFVNLLSPLGSVGKEPTGAQQVGGGQQDSVLGRMLGPDNEVEIVYVANFENVPDMPARTNPKAQSTPTGPKPTGANSLLLVTGRPAALTAFEKALNLFYGNIPQVQIDVRVVEFQSSDALSFGVTPLDANTPTFRNLDGDKLINQITADFPLTAPLSGSGRISDRGLITLGGIHDSWELNALLEALETTNQADILTEPTLVVRNGGLATVSTVTEQPFPQAKISNQTVTSTNISFKDVGVVMDIRPEVAGSSVVMLNIYVSVSAVTGFAASEPVPTPIVATRSAATTVHLRHGESLVIGGLVQNQSIDSESKFPILGDIPILGYLFRSTSRQVQKTNLQFMITPTIHIGRRGMRMTGN